MATIVLYRISSAEVIKISTKGQLFSDRDTTYWGILTNPSFPDGLVLRENLGQGVQGPLRVLGFAKFANVGSNICRNATQLEINGFDAAQTADDNKIDAQGAIDFFETHPQFRKMMVAFADIIKDEFNILRALHALPNRTLGQLKTAIRNRISEND